VFTAPAQTHGFPAPQCGERFVCALNCLSQHSSIAARCVPQSMPVVPAADKQQQRQRRHGSGEACRLFPKTSACDRSSRTCERMCLLSGGQPMAVAAEING